jgi:hypothetical protein
VVAAGFRSPPLWRCADSARVIETDPRFAALVVARTPTGKPHRLA